MLSRELLRQVRRLQLQARRAVEDQLGGAYRSVFKGGGIAFEEVREYQPGDEIRAIDWNVTARMGHPFVKRFVEERELTVMLVIDSSASQAFGTGIQQKREAAAELAAVVAFSAIANNDRVGLLHFTDRVERIVPPRKGSRHVLRLLREVLFFQPQGRGTDIREALRVLNRVLHRRALVFLFSDFLDHDFEKSLRRTGRRHDLIAIALNDPRELDLPNVGLLQIEDCEDGSRVLLDTSSAAVREGFALRTQERRESLRQLARSGRIDLIEVCTDGGGLDALARFFRLRQLRRGRP
jgi:uncharacterized protein (DUF58 family)